MIIEYNTLGEIFHVIFDPVPPGTYEHFQSLGKTCLEIPENTAVRYGTHYVVDGELADRPTLPDLNGSTISPVPNGTVVFLNKAKLGSVTDGEVSLTGSAPGTYELYLEPPFPTQPRTYMVTVS